MKTICVILGTRPEAIKLAPVVLALKRNNAYRVLVVNTEQQKELSNQTLSFFSIKPDFRLDAMIPNQTLGGLQARMLEKLAKVYDNNQIDATIVQGDTMTVFCAALNSFYHKIPVFHVEAGLRSYNLFEPFPEEAMRQMTSRITDLHFAPTKLAYQALLHEGIKKDSIVLTGNTVIDALDCLSSDVLKNAQKKLETKNIKFDDKLVLITAHRRENHGERLDKILSAIKILAEQFSDHQFVLPVHPNPNVHDKVHQILGKLSNVVLTEPLDYPELVCLMKNTKLVLTDSGGIQEEAPTFGNPVLVMRYETERTEGVKAGFAKLVGADEQKIITEASSVLSKLKSETRLDGRQNPYGDGQASLKIVEAIKNYFLKDNKK
ncbi:MAG: UDP-N-acetylglucosamine 2-epimerase (non-hydrolyzing) [Alphaproteobacteria bacterium]|nr:UDP-N-acetylglucosamine 2-epimerase (non-hydrolyzing) [Alphaproteobacteria bacterium]